MSPMLLLRRVFPALAAAALLAVLLRPACEVWFAHFGAGGAPGGALALSADAPIAQSGDHRATQCCADVKDAQQIAPLHVVAGGAKPIGGVAPLALVAVLSGIALITRQPHWLRAPPRRPRSFYLRSARILR